ncbi:hypothetical protein F6X40_16570 [Paraburkholderia sp. UCT31]|uniref:hypothetical protein n=1 Tax=Paraburkholderia sp. UCT31 TaxID=2615209 RepID=UPI001656118B|nr:hypothetical protein [Paraburkholderia sp. UCT31]MBC8738391.1 hypothetical protein [Paraburkholderia sp. UCT31]
MRKQDPQFGYHPAVSLRPQEQRFAKAPPAHLDLFPAEAQHVERQPVEGLPTVSTLSPRVRLYIGGITALLARFSMRCI